MIHFVGAGPGATDLITIRGLKHLQEAGLIIYAGSLVNPELLRHAKNDCRIFDSSAMTLEEVIENLHEAYRAGIEAVRLHTGDPSIYGAIREQIDMLKDLGIPYDITPGVSSFCAAAAAAEVEYTLPSVSQTVIISRMEGRTKVPDKEKIRLLASHQASMVLFLSSGFLGVLSQELVAGGYSPDTKAAIVYKASWPEQKIIRTTISKLQEPADEAGIKNTALILIGDFLGDKYELSQLYNKHFSHGFRKACL